MSDYDDCNVLHDGAEGTKRPDAMDGPSPEFLAKVSAAAAEAWASDPRFGSPTPRGRLGRIGRYHLDELLGKGGFGVVYKAFDEQKNYEVVAVKVLLPKHAASKQERARFAREAKAIEVKSPHVVEIRAIEDSQDFGPYLVMEFVEGKSLSTLLKEMKLSHRDVAKVMQGTALGLAAIHGCELIHRDVTPANILVDNNTGEAKITDFGQARRSDGKSPKVTADGKVIGTFRYMSPEQTIPPYAVDYRTDIYSLGVVMFEALTGDVEILAKHLKKEAPFLSPWHPDVSPALELICLKCLEKNPERRYTTAQELADALGEFLEERHLFKAKFRLRCKQGRRWIGKHPLSTVVAGLMVIALFSLFGFFHHGRLDDQVRRADGKTRQAQEAEERTAEERYANRLFAVQLAIHDGDCVRGMQLLAECEEKRRCFVARHLWHRLNPEYRSFLAHQGAVRGLAVSLDGTKMVTGGDDGVVRLWDSATGKLLLHFKHPTAVTAVALHPGFPFVVSASADGTMALCDFANQKVPHFEKYHQGSVSGLAFTHKPEFGGMGGHGLVWSAGSDGKVYRWDVMARKPHEEPLNHGTAVIQIVSIPEKRVVFTLGSDGLAKVWDHTGEEAPAKSWKAASVTPDAKVVMKVSSNDRRIATLHPSGILNLWMWPALDADAKTAVENKPEVWRQGLRPSALAWLPDDSSFVSGAEDGRVVGWKIATGQASQLRVGHDAEVTTLAVWAPLGTTAVKRLVSADAKGVVKLLRWTEVPGRIDLEREPEQWEKYREPSPDGLCRAEIDIKTRTIRLFGSRDEKLLILSADGIPFRAGFSPDGKRLVAGVDTPQGRFYRV